MDTKALEAAETDVFDPPTTSRSSERRRLAPAPPDARWDPTVLPADDGDDGEPRWTELQLAAREGNPARVSAILSRYPDADERARVVNAPAEGWYSQTALQAACMHEHETVVRMLLDAGAEVGAEGGGNIHRNAFEYACGTGNVGLVRILLDAGARRYVNRVRVTRYQGRTPVQAAAENGSIELLVLLLGLGADVNAPPSPAGGRTALQAACYEGHVELAKCLLAHGADVNAAAPRHGGFTALEGACRVGEGEIVQILLSAGAQVNAGKQGTALHAAAEGGHVEIVRMLLVAGADCNALVGRAGMRGQTALQSARVQGHSEVVEMLMEAGASGSVNGGRKLYGHVEARSWAMEEMAVDGERGRSASGARQRAPSPNPMARRTGHYDSEYSKLGRRSA